MLAGSPNYVPRSETRTSRGASLGEIRTDHALASIPLAVKSYPTGTTGSVI
jgi:hypothetical protein